MTDAQGTPIPSAFDEDGLLDALSELRRTAIGRICLFSATGDPSVAILTTAEKHVPDVIILESCRQTSWETVRDGSIVNELIERTPCDLIVVRTEQRSGHAVPEAMQFSISLN